MKRIIQNTAKYIFLAVLAIQVFNASCAKNIYPDPTFQNIGSDAESRELDEFLDGGVEKAVNSSGISAGKIIKIAQKYLGVPHAMGGTTMRGMDCSGLVATVFAAHGIRLPHNSEEQARYGRMLTNRSELREGDLVFFIRSYKTHRFITHSGIYTGNNNFIHASSSQGVTITSLDNTWWKEKFIFGTRILE